MALMALAWTLEDAGRARRLLDLTGLDADALRSRIGDPVVHVALLSFLEAHEPDLIACAESVGTTPAGLVAARRRLEA